LASLPTKAIIQRAPESATIFRPFARFYYRLL
jgi:hypothetical protein